PRLGEGRVVLLHAQPVVFGTDLGDNLPLPHHRTEIYRDLTEPSLDLHTDSGLIECCERAVSSDRFAERRLSHSGSFNLAGFGFARAPALTLRSLVVALTGYERKRAQ